MHVRAPKADLPLSRCHSPRRTASLRGEMTKGSHFWELYRTLIQLNDAVRQGNLLVFRSPIDNCTYDDDALVSKSFSICSLPCSFATNRRYVHVISNAICHRQHGLWHLDAANASRYSLCSFSPHPPSYVSCEEPCVLHQQRYRCCLNRIHRQRVPRKRVCCVWDVVAVVGSWPRRTEVAGQDVWLVIYMLQLALVNAIWYTKRHTVLTRGTSFTTSRS